MKKLDFLKKSLQWGCYKKLSWMTTAFSVFREPEGEWEKDKFIGRIVSQPWGYSFVNENLELEKIDDAKPNEPIFGMMDEIVVDSSWIANIEEGKQHQVIIGTLISNQILLADNFGNKIPFIDNDVSIPKIEEEVIKRKGAPNEPGKISLPEYLNMGKGIEYIKMLNSFSVYSLTVKNTSSPTGIKEFKAKLIKEYGDKLSDPVYLAEFENRLKDFDTEYLKGDPTLGKLISGKIKNNGRRKLYLSSGAEGGLGSPMIPITESLVEGVPLTPKNFAALVNGSRSGSYFRGVDTVKGGVSFKILIRVLSSFSIVEGDCGSKYGLKTFYRKKNIHTLVGRRFVGANQKPIENINEAGNYLGKTLHLRSVIRCKSPGQTFCSTCAGPRLSSFKEGLAIPATDLTSTVLAASMAAMHKNTTTIARLDYLGSLS